jgi:hypothetical protein
MSHQSVLKQPIAKVDRIREFLDPVQSLALFSSRPLCSAAVGYGAPTGATGDTNIMVADGVTFEYHIKGTQTILAPVFGANGLNVSLDQTNNDGIEITEGITARSKGAKVIGENKFFVELTLSVEDVSGADICYLGFRKTEAYQAALASYTDFAGLTINAGTINFIRRLNSGSVLTTDTGEDLADNGTVTLRVEVDGVGKVKVLVDGVDVTPADFTFDDGDVVIPHFFLLHDTDIAGEVNFKRYERDLIL